MKSFFSTFTVVLKQAFASMFLVISILPFSIFGLLYKIALLIFKSSEKLVGVKFEQTVGMEIFFRAGTLAAFMTTRFALLLVAGIICIALATWLFRSARGLKTSFRKIAIANLAVLLPLVVLSGAAVFTWLNREIILYIIQNPDKAVGIAQFWFLLKLMEYGTFFLK